MDFITLRAASDFSEQLLEKDYSEEKLSESAYLYQKGSSWGIVSFQGKDLITVFSSSDAADPEAIKEKILR